MSKPQEMKWRIVAFNHPKTKHTLLYRQNLTTKGLIQAVERAVELGANLLSVRGFREKPQSLQ